VTQNGLDASLYKDGPNEKFNFIYASNPTRGLLVLLQLWPKIKATVPAATLDIYNDYLPGSSERKYTLKLVDSLDGVRWHGMVGHAELSDAFARASLWLYPTSFPEISCITAMRAQVSFNEG